MHHPRSNHGIAVAFSRLANGNKDFLIDCLFRLDNEVTNAARTLFTEVK